MKNFIKYGGYIFGFILLLILLFPSTFLPAGVTMGFALAIFTYSCTKNVSGVRKIFIAEKSVATAFTITSGEISAVTGTTPFMRVDTIQDTAKWTQKIAKVGRNNHKVDNEIEAVIRPMAKETNTFLQSLIDGSPCGFFVLVQNENGKCFVVGFSAEDLRDRPLQLEAGDYDSGAGVGSEGANILIKITGSMTGLALPLDSTLTAAVLAGTSTICKWS